MVGTFHEILDSSSGKLGKNQINYGPEGPFFRRIQWGQIFLNWIEFWGAHFFPTPRVNATIAFAWLWPISCEGGHEAARGLAAASCWADLFEISRRRTWPFHIQNPERTITGWKTNRTAGDECDSAASRAEQNCLISQRILLLMMPLSFLSEL